MNSLLKKYFSFNFWYLYLINVGLYILVIFIEYKYIFTDDYYTQYLRPLFHSQNDFIEALKESSQAELYNYLWCPVHVAIQTFLISLCLFIGFNALNYYIKWLDSIKATLLAIIVFSINNVIIIGLKACGIIAYNPETVDDVYFFQSIGYFFIDEGYPDIIYEFLEKFNFIELIFCLFLSYTMNLFLQLKYSKVLFFTIMIYLFGTIIYICITRFIAYLV